MAGSASISSSSVSKKYVSRKVKTVRWKPPSTSDFGDTNTFVTGSWDDCVRVVYREVVLLARMSLGFVLDLYLYLYFLSLCVNFSFGPDTKRMDGALV